MSLSVSKRFKKFKDRLRSPMGSDLSTPEARRLAWWHFQLFDHAFFRVWWTNFDKVAEGVYRSNQPNPKRLSAYKKKGIVAVLSLRANTGKSSWLFEKEACDALGLDLRVATIYPRRPASADELLNLIDVMRAMPKPFVMHCKSGADRAGLASVLYKLAIEGSPIEEARPHLGLRYLHLKSTATGVLDFIIDRWIRRNRETGIGIEEWLRREYDPAAIFADFKAGSPA